MVIEATRTMLVAITTGTITRSGRKSGKRRSLSWGREEDLTKLPDGKVARSEAGVEDTEANLENVENTEIGHIGGIE